MSICFIATIMMLSGVVSESPPFEKFVVRSSGEHLVHRTNTSRISDGHDVVIAIGAEPEVVVHVYAPHAMASRDSGPLPWGVVDGAVYDGGYLVNVLNAGYEMVNVGAGPLLIDDMIALEEARGRDPREVRHRIVVRMRDHRRRYYFNVDPLNRYIMDRANEAAGFRGEDTLARNWDLSLDAVYRSLDEITVAAAHEGNLLVWDLDRTQDPNNTQWTTHTPVPTQIDGHFRILLAGEQFYLIDAEGMIYADVDETHQSIGSVRGWDGDSPVILLDDQQSGRIGFLRVDGAGVVTVLDVDWTDASFAGDFLTEVGSVNLVAAIARMAEIMREDAGE